MHHIHSLMKLVQYMHICMRCDNLVTGLAAACNDSDICTRVHSDTFTRIPESTFVMLLSSYMELCVFSLWKIFGSNSEQQIKSIFLGRLVNVFPCN